jgi:hypothetical protein
VLGIRPVQSVQIEEERKQIDDLGLEFIVFAQCRQSLGLHSQEREGNIFSLSICNFCVLFIRAPTSVLTSLHSKASSDHTVLTAWIIAFSVCVSIWRQSADMNVLIQVHVHNNSNQLYIFWQTIWIKTVFSFLHRKAADHNILTAWIVSLPYVLCVPFWPSINWHGKFWFRYIKTVSSFIFCVDRTGWPHLTYETHFWS